MLSCDVSDCPSPTTRSHPSHHEEVPVSLRLTNSPPPDWMPEVGEHFHVVNRARKTCQCHGTQAIRETIEREVEEIRLLLTRFSTMIVTGTMRIVVFPTTYTMTGELTTYFVPTASERDALVNEIDQRVFLLKDTYGQHIERVEFWLEQVYDKNVAASLRNPSLSELSLHDYAQLAVKQGASCFNCGRPAQVEDLQHYGPHPEGWRVKGYALKQWLFFKCPACRYQTSFVKLKIARPAPSAT